LRTLLVASDIFEFHRQYSFFDDQLSMPCSIHSSMINSKNNS
jgi:hypothetical protein